MSWPKLCDCPNQAKALATMVILLMGLGLFFSMAQVIIHDIIPTLQSSEKMAMEMGAGEGGESVQTHGDLFAEMPMEEAPQPFYQSDEFIFALKFTHVHMFGMSLIFIFMGLVVLFLNVSHRVHTWLIVLPFVGVLFDLVGVWLKIFVSPVFIWLNVLGVVIFGTVFVINAILAMLQMWFPRPGATQAE